MVHKYWSFVILGHDECLEVQMRQYIMCPDTQRCVSLHHMEYVYLSISQILYEKI
jgi:hypothetical protein